MELVEQIKDYLKTNKITQKEFARRVGISVGTLQSWLHKGIKPSGEITRRLRVVMDLNAVDMAYLRVDKSKCSNTFGYYLSLVRSSLGITAKDMSLVLDMSQAAYSLWEVGDTQPQPRQIPRIANILDIDEDTAYNWAYSTKVNHVSADFIEDSRNALVDRFLCAGRVM